MSAPERIYLQDAGDYSKAAALEVTWCVEPQDDDDTEYTRSDLITAMIREAVAAEAKIWAEAIETYFDGTAVGDVERHADAIRARGDA